MKKIFTIVLLFSLFTNFSIAQVENALHFDGIDDEVTVPNASSLIISSGQITLSCWVYPENSAPAFPDYDGFCGFRNDVDADFYLVQLTADSVEARFRNAAGVNFDIIDSSLQINEWQHYVLTYDGNLLSLYRNGNLSGSIAASGSIDIGTETLRIGNIVYFANNFFFNGKIDEVALWTRSLTASEVNCIYESDIDITDAGLVLYYEFNQGIPGGNNNSVNSLIPQKGTLQGTLNNFSLSGNNSNWVPGIMNGTTFLTTICDGDTVAFGSQLLTAPGIYHEAYPLVGGCDSIVWMILNPGVDVTVADSLTFNLLANQSGATYQWLDCNNGSAPIPGETFQSFSPANDGDYAVIVTFFGCTDTSLCYTWIHPGIDESISSSNVKLFPNPVIDKLNFSHLSSMSVVEISDLTGRMLMSAKIDVGESLDVSTLLPGIYTVAIKNSSGMSYLKILKN